MMVFPLQTKPYMLNCEEGQRHESLGALIRVKATSEQTGGEFNLFDVICPPDFATPLYILYTDDVAIYILGGALTFFWGSEKKEAVTGSYFFQPRGTPQGFRVKGSMPARLLFMTIPAGLDHFIVEQELLYPKSEPATIAARYKIEILGPLPE